MSYQPIIIIGAPRSGTNMLRDVLCKLRGIGTWPCDEINYIWRHGNINKVTDELSHEVATLDIQNYIRREFDVLAKKENLDILVEKTCANSLRVPFVDVVIPNAKYIFIYRDGMDVVGSAIKRWKADLDIPYLLRKARYVPKTDLAYYAVRYFANRLYRFFSKNKRLALWGPKFKGLDDALKEYSLEEVCALQWKRCVDLSEQAFAEIPEYKVVRVRYESFVSNPTHELERILRELNISFDEMALVEATKNVSEKNVGKGRKALSHEQVKKIECLIHDSLKRFKYE